MEQKARELGRLIGQSSEYQALKRANENLSADREAATVLNRMTGRSPYSHTFSTSNESGYFPLPGWGLLTAGWAHPGEHGAGSTIGHTAGNLAGLAFESRGGAGVVVGARATPVTSFAHLGHYAAASAGGPNQALAAGGLVRQYDTGGYLPPGLSLSYNGTSKPESVLTDEQSRALFARAGLGPTGPAGGRATVNIEGDFYADGADPHRIAADLDWMSRARGGA
jgi:hypothetical protein